MFNEARSLDILLTSSGPIGPIDPIMRELAPET